MKPFGPEDRARRRLARLQSFQKIADAFATSTALPGNAPVVDRKRLPQEAIRLVSDFLATLVWPMMPQLVYKGVRTASRDEDTPVEDADAQVLIAAKITTVSGVRREVEVPVVVRNGKLLEPSVMMVDGVPRIIAQSLVDELTRGGTFRQSVDPRGNIYGPPMDREAHERYLEQGDEFKARDRVSRGMYTVASRKAQLDPESQNILQQLVDLGPWSQSSPGATIEPELLQPLLRAGLVEQQGQSITITDAGRAALGKTAQSTGDWWAHSLGGVGVDIGPFRSLAQAKRYLKDERHDSGPFQPDGAGGIVGENFAIDQTPPRDGKDVSAPRGARTAQAEPCGGLWNRQTGDRTPCPNGAPADYRVYSEGWGQLYLPYCEGCLDTYRQWFPDAQFDARPIQGKTAQQVERCPDCEHDTKDHFFQEANPPTPTKCYAVAEASGSGPWGGSGTTCGCEAAVQGRMKFGARSAGPRSRASRASSAASPS
jgi:hypothetical protein